MPMVKPSKLRLTCSICATKRLSLCPRNSTGIVTAIAPIAMAIAAISFVSKVFSVTKKEYPISNATSASARAVNASMLGSNRIVKSLLIWLFWSFPSWISSRFFVETIRVSLLILTFCFRLYQGRFFLSRYFICRDEILNSSGLSIFRWYRPSEFDPNGTFGIW